MLDAYRYCLPALHGVLATVAQMSEGKLPRSIITVLKFVIMDAFWSLYKCEESVFEQVFAKTYSSY
jgi:hypothetical protein